MEELNDLIESMEFDLNNFKKVRDALAKNDFDKAAKILTYMDTCQRDMMPEEIMDKLIALGYF